MRSAKNYAIVVLAGTTLACAVLAWRQYQELVVLRARALDMPSASGPAGQRVEASAPLLDPHPSAAESATASADPSSAASASEAAAGSADRARLEGVRRGANVMDDPEVQKLMAVQRKASLDARYAALFRLLKLPPDQLDKLKNLLVDHSNAISDVMAAAREQGVQRRGDPGMFQKLVAEAQAETDAAIRETLGEVGYAQFKEYERTLPQRTVATQLEQRLSYSSTPLTAEQSAQLVQILSTASNTPQNPNFFIGGAGSPAAGPAGGITDAAINQALGVLAAPQIEALRELQREQQIQAELGAAMRTRFQRSQPTPPAVVTPIVPITPAAPSSQTSGQ